MTANEKMQLRINGMSYNQITRTKFVIQNQEKKLQGLIYKSLGLDKHKPGWVASFSHQSKCFDERLDAVKFLIKLMK